MTAPLRAAILALVVSLGAAPCALGQTAPRDAAFAATTLVLAADGEAKAVPDMATLSLGVETTAPSAREAMAANAQAMARVIAALKGAGITDRDLQTSTLNLAPQYAYEEGKPPRLTGYQASNQLNVTVRKLAALGATVDAASGAGATNIGSVSFGLAELAAVENTARIAAVKALEDKASLYAQAVGYHIVRLVSLSEGMREGAPEPRPMLMAARAKAAPSPVEAGENTVSVAVTGVFELGR